MTVPVGQTPPPLLSHLGMHCSFLSFSCRRQVFSLRTSGNFLPSEWAVSPKVIPVRFWTVLQVSFSSVLRFVFFSPFLNAFSYELLSLSSVGRFVAMVLRRWTAKTSRSISYIELFRLLRSIPTFFPPPSGRLPILVGSSLYCSTSPSLSPPPNTFVLLFSLPFPHRADRHGE